MYTIREMKESEYCMLKDFLSEAIYLPEGMEPPPRSVLELPELGVYISDFGKGPADIALAAETEGRVRGALWVRIMDDYGHVEDDVPSMAIAVFKGYRGQGMGEALIKRMFDILRLGGYRGVSLSVQKENPAVKLYLRLGFETIKDRDGELVMAKYFKEC